MIDDIAYYFITDASLSRKTILDDVKAALDAGVKIVQYRNKTDYATRPQEMYEEAWSIRELCKGKAIFLVNDYPELAFEVDADGVHIGQRDGCYHAARRLLGERKIIGVSVHTYQHALDAIGNGADYLGIGPIYPTKTKTDAEAPTGTGLITHIKHDYPSVPLVAIGGIKRHNAADVIHAGADGLCAMSDVLANPDVTGTIREYQELFRR